MTRAQAGPSNGDSVGRLLTNLHAAAFSARRPVPA
jgi:hypothetical protein